MPLHVHQLRGELPETVHPISAALSDGESLRWTVGDDVSCFWRSGCKPMQLTTSLEQLPADVVAGLSEEDLAVGTASHSGEPVHVARVVSLLERFGLGADALRCGAHWPMHEASTHALVRAAQPCSALHNNCSGKHTFMAAAAAARGWDPDYLPLAHPLQRLNLERIQDWCGTDAGTAVDGCGVPCFHLPISGMARGFARLAHAMADGDGLPGRIGWAMQRAPYLVSGDGRLDLVLTQAAREPVAVKFGAEGLFAMALPQRRLGLLVKARTGNGDALAVAVRAVLDEVAPGLLADVEWPWAVVKNVVGREVGVRRAVWT